jgi:hypothetical protein
VFNKSFVAIVDQLKTRGNIGWAVFGIPGVNRVAIGVRMIPRGEVGLVFAGIGSASDILDKPLEVSIIIKEMGLKPRPSRTALQYF